MTNYERLIFLQKTYPELTFNNNGYERLSKEIIEKHKEQIDEISSILKKHIEGFQEFNNFKVSKRNNEIKIRVQHRWSKEHSFIGVGYFDIESEEFKQNK